MKKKFIFGIICLFAMVLGVKAEVKVPSFVEGKKIVLNMPAPATEEDKSRFSSLAQDFLRAYHTEDYDHIHLQDCNDNFSECMAFYAKKEGNELTNVQGVKVAVVFDDTYSETFKKLVSNGVFDTEVSDKYKWEYYSSFYRKAYKIQDEISDYENGDSYSFDPEFVAEDFSSMFVILKVYKHGSDKPIALEAHRVALKYASSTSKTAKTVEEATKKIAEATKGKKVTIEDMEIVKGHYYSSLVGSYDGRLLEHSSEFKKLIGTTNLGFESYTYFEDSNDYNSFEEIISDRTNKVYVYYDNVKYAEYMQTVVKKHIIYIPTATENTTEAFIKAATDKIKAALGLDVKITVESNIEAGSEYEEALGNASVTSGKLYSISFGEYFPVTFAIVKNDEKAGYTVATEEKQVTTDLETNVEVSFTAKDIPADTKVKVEVIAPETETFKTITDKLKVDNAYVVDIKLVSETQGNVTKISEGTFKVTIPIPEELLKEKELSAYYIDGDKIEEYPITVGEDGKGSFETTHFSIYTVAKRLNLNSKDMPAKTLDNVETYAIVATVSLISLIGTSIYLKKREN